MKAMLKKIVDIYRTKKQRNMLIVPDSFSYLFQKAELETKVKNGLLLIAKDLRAKYGFPVLIVRPRAMLTRVFVSVPDPLLLDFQKEIGEYSDCRGKSPDRIEPKPDGTEERISSGTVYSVKIGELWEKQYSELSFGAFKQKFFFRDFLADKDGRHPASRIQVNITYHRDYEEVKKFVGNLLNVIVELFTMHRRAEKKAFELWDFLSELNVRFGGHVLDRNQAGLLLDMMAVEVSEKADFLESRKVHKRKKKAFD